MMKSVASRAALSLCIAAVSGTGLLAAPIKEQAPPPGAAGDAAALFGQREAIFGAALSPDGKTILYLAADGTVGTALMVAPSDASAEPKPISYSNGRPTRLQWCDWASDTRIVCAMFGTGVADGHLYSIQRLFSVAAAGGDVRMLADRGTTSQQLRSSQFDGGVIDWRGGADGKILMERDHVPEQDIGTHLAKTDNGLGVDLVDARTTTPSVVERASKNAVSYLSDGRGDVRMMATRPMSSGGYLQDVVEWYYRKPESRRWEHFSTVKAEENEGLQPLSVDASSNSVLCLDKQDGREALFRVPLDGAMTRTLVYADPKVDVDDVLRLGRQARLIGARTAAEKGSIVYFDPEYRKLAASLSKALPGLPQINFDSSSADESRLLISAGSDTDAGRYYVFDRTTKHLNEIALVRPQLEHMKLAAMTPVTLRAADGTAIPAYLTLPADGGTRNLPAIVMPHGGPASHDDWGFDWLAQYFAHQGFAVLQPEFRGSTGYGDAWMLQNGFKSWRTAIGDVVDAGRWLISQGIAAPDRLAIFGWSYGGYAALQSNILAPDLFKAVVAVAPVTDLDQIKTEAIGFTSAGLVKDYIGSGPWVQDGSPARHAAMFRAPVMMFHGTADQNVGVSETRLMEARLRAAGKPVTVVIYPDLDHQLPSGEIRADMLRRADQFLRKSMNMAG